MKFWRKPLDQAGLKVPRGEVYILEERCKGCNFCVEFCPLGVLAASDKFNSKGYHPPYVTKEGVCANCGLCQMLCPEFAIYSLAEDGTEVIQ